MFASGHLAERSDLRLFLVWGMLGARPCGAARLTRGRQRIHVLALWPGVFPRDPRAVVLHLRPGLLQCRRRAAHSMQLVCGLYQSTGWPTVVAIMGNWFPKGKRGLVMGVWNAHTSVGNILGTVIPGALLGLNWSACSRTERA